MNQIVTCIAAAAALTAACDNHHLIGGVDGSSGASSDAGRPTAVLPDAGPPREVGVLGPTSTWTGYIENPSNTLYPEQLVMTFATDDAGQVVGTFRFGNGTPPPPATDPNAIYPPGLNTMITSGGQYPVDGFTYTMMGGTLVGNRLRFGIAMQEPWAGWCALQTPAVDGSGMCVPNWGWMQPVSGSCYQTNPTTGERVYVSCEKLLLCSATRLCVCDDRVCVANLEPNGFPGDMIVSGDRADGSMGLNAYLPVHFTKSAQ
jgi:hypothetical protein